MNAHEQLHQYFQELEQQQRYSGVALITQDASQLYVGAYGYASRAWNIKNTLDTRFDTASITKLFTATAILQLIDQGLLSLNTRVIDFLGLTDAPISRDVTVFHLLTHSSGIGDDAEEENNEDYEDLWKTKPNYSVTATADFLPQFIHKPANFAPGQGCRYCNCSFILLGLIIEKLTDMAYREYVQQHIFNKIGMADSEFCRLDRVHERVADGCDPILDEAEQIIGWKKNIYSFPPVGSPDSGAHVTAADLDRFLRAIQSGKLLSSALMQDFLTPKVLYYENEHWRVMFGYVLEFFFDKSGRLVFYQKDGVNAGVSGIIRHYPAQNINVVLLSNMMGGVWKPIRTIHEIIMARELNDTPTPK